MEHLQSESKIRERLTHRFTQPQWLESLTGNTNNGDDWVEYFLSHVDWTMHLQCEVMCLLVLLAVSLS